MIQVCRRAVRIGLVLAVVGSGCGGASASDVEDGGDAGDGAGEVATDGDGAVEESGGDGAADIPAAPSCGNGLLEDGEECDDGNRIDGDDCDWNCRIGPGEPPGAPDPSAAPFEPEGEVAVLEGLVAGEALALEDELPIPLVWNGSSLATLLRERSSDGATVRVRFHRFRSDGTGIGPDWFYDAAGWSFDRLDLVWHGSGYGLFFTERDVGVCYQRLQEDGKPLGTPIVLVPGGRCADADRIEGGFVVSFAPDGATVPGLAVQRFADDGSPIEPRLAVCAAASKVSNVAAAPSGFAVMGHCWDPVTVDSRRTLFGFSVLSPELDRARGTEWIDRETQGGTAGRTDDGFFAAWDRRSIAPRRSFCVGRFDPEGRLLRPPGCTLLSPEWTEPIHPAGGVHADRDADGLGLVFAANNQTPAVLCTDRLMFLRTDADGRAVGEPANVLGLDAAGRFDGFNIAWAGDSYVVLAKVAECASPDATGYPPGLYVRRFVPVSP